MPTIMVQWSAGKTVEQKRALVKGITEVVTKVADVTPDAVTIIIHDIPAENSGKGGKLRLPES